MLVSQYFDQSVRVDSVPASSVPDAIDAQASTPVAVYARALRGLRGKSKNIGDELDQLEFGRLVAETLTGVQTELQLPEGHFSVDTSGEPLLVTEGTGSHWVMPTNFENGAYFSTPHADHQYGLTATQLPRIHIGRYVKFGKGAGVNAGGDIIIGDGSWLSPGSLLLRQDHTAYGRPSVGSRTVAMTRQPGIRMGEFSWVGRDAMVGWNCDYIGAGGIVGTRSFVNSWVGDHAIVGDHDRILQYQPFKAFLADRYHPTVEETLRITDWHRIDEDWRVVYDRTRTSLRGPAFDPDLASWLRDSVGASYRALVVEPRSLSFLELLDGARVDIASSGTALTPYILQWAMDHRNRRIRVRTDLDGASLPLETSGNQHYLKNVGYDVIVYEYDESATALPLTEIQRPLASGGLLITDEAGAAESGVPDRLVEIKEIAFGGKSLKVFEKK
ncbi:hypothetical protein KO481_26145 [Nocardia sp. NEAU-G5]|uniref:Uncharacterized protein n=1 Tax=Nocardia albiluteola TaxID=2842303 RepID=A0ABS6B3V8_9NOCA|nr:hypothetical protein [Nocardia albiluteola]MBU3065000.1 hypothetical protein [Nocardia albiluteola]